MLNCLFKHNLIVYPLLFIFVISCSPKISYLAQVNRHVKNFNIHVVNDSLQLHLISPADITYLIVKQDIKTAVKKHKLKLKNEILIYGTTPNPAYEFVVTIGRNKEIVQKNKLILDTVINSQMLHLMAITTDDKAIVSMEADLKEMLRKLRSGSNYLDEMNTVMDIVNASMNSNLYYKTLTEIQQFKIPKNQGNSLELQMQLTYASFLGRNKIYDQLLSQLETSFEPKDSISRAVKNNELQDDAVFDKIVAGAKSTNIVMVNENHFYPSHRLFITQLLAKLRAIGYTHLALEALASPNDSLLNLSQQFPKLQTGFYTREQNYGNLLREAKRLGYQFIAYENEDPKKDREVGQAENLYRKTIGKDKNAKVLVIAGIDHILEQPSSSGKKWMATIFKSYYQIDPLTISQTHLNNYRKYSNTTYKLLSKIELNGITPVASVDFFLLNNQNNQPGRWLSGYNFENKYHRPVQVSLFNKTELKNELDYQQCVPYFVKLVEKDKNYTLPFQKNEAVFMVVYDKLGNILEKRSIN